MYAAISANSVLQKSNKIWLSFSRILSIRIFPSLGLNPAFFTQVAPGTSAKKLSAQLAEVESRLER